MKSPVKSSLNPNLISILISSFFMVVGFTMLMPLVSVYFVNDVGMTAAVVGTALAVRQFTQQGLGVASGFIADTIGIKRLILLGLLVRAFGFIFLAWAEDIWQLFFGLCLSAIGGALFEVPSMAAVVKLTSKAQRSHFYILVNWVVGVGTTVGPLIGALAIGINFATVCYIAGGCFVINFLLLLYAIPSSIDAEKTPEEKVSTTKLRIRENKTFFMYLLLMAGYWFVSMQINITFPLFIEKLTGNIASVGVMFALSAMITVLLQYPLVKWVQRYCTDDIILVLGILLMSLACLLIAIVEQTYVLFLLNVGLFSIGALLTRPSHQTLTASFAQNNTVASFMGLSMLSLAIGGGLGNMLGGWLYDKAYLDNAPMIPEWLPWVCFVVVGTVSAMGMLILFSKKHSSPESIIRKAEHH